MAKKNYAAICSSIIAVCGGEDNISSVSHCMTRLRVQLFDGNKLNREKAGKIPGVLNLVIQNGEYQFVIGQDVPNLYAEFIKREGIKTSGEVADAAALKQDTEAKKGNVNEYRDVLYRRNLFSGYSGVNCRGAYRRRIDTVDYAVRSIHRVRYLYGNLCNQSGDFLFPSDFHRFFRGKQVEVQRIFRRLFGSNPAVFYY